MKFTEQKNLMEECVDVGEQDKKKQYTTSSCKSLILEIGRAVCFVRKPNCSLLEQLSEKKKRV